MSTNSFKIPEMTSMKEIPEEEPVFLPDAEDDILVILHFFVILILQ